MVDPSQREVRREVPAPALLLLIHTATNFTTEAIRDSFMTMEGNSDPFNDKGTLRPTEQPVRLTPCRLKG